MERGGAPVAVHAYVGVLGNGKRAPGEQVRRAGASRERFGGKAGRAAWGPIAASCRLPGVPGTHHVSLGPARPRLFAGDGRKPNQQAAGGVRGHHQSVWRRRGALWGESGAQLDAGLVWAARAPAAPAAAFKCGSPRACPRSTSFGAAGSRMLGPICAPIPGWPCARPALPPAHRCCLSTPSLPQSDYPEPCTTGSGAACGYPQARAHQHLSNPAAAAYGQVRRGSTGRRRPAPGPRRSNAV